MLLQWQISRKIAARETEIAALESQIAPLRTSASRWLQVEPAADDKYFPLEMLHLIVAAMPANHTICSVSAGSPMLCRAMKPRNTTNGAT